jgi:hypothetical protein
VFCAICVVVLPRRIASNAHSTAGIAIVQHAEVSHRLEDDVSQGKEHLVHTPKEMR